MSAPPRCGKTWWCSCIGLNAKRLSSNGYLASFKIVDMLKITHFFNGLKCGVDQTKVFNGRTLKAAHLKNAFCFVANQIPYFDIANSGVKTAGITFFVMEVNNDGILYFTNFNIAVVDIFNQAAANGVRLKTNTA